MNKTLKNGKKPNFEPNFGLNGPNMPPSQKTFSGFYLYQQLDIVPIILHPMRFPGKLTNQTAENGEKPNFGPDFDPFGPNVRFPNCSVEFSSASGQTLFHAVKANEEKKTEKKTNKPNLRKWQKTYFRA